MNAECIHSYGASLAALSNGNALLGQAHVATLQFTRRGSEDALRFDGFIPGSGRNGIPSAFIVKGGQIQWIGHPMEMDGPLAEIKSGKFDEVQKYLVLSGHIITPRLVVVNEAFWQGLSAADRKLIEDAIRAGIAWQDEELAKQEKSLVDTFKAAGMTVITPDANAFRAPVLAWVEDPVELFFLQIQGGG